MGYDHRSLRSKLPWYDRYAIWAFGPPFGRGVLLPSLLLMAPAIAFADLAGFSRASRIVLVAFGIAAAALAIVVLARVIHVTRMELHHERHVDAFWDRKLKAGGVRMWLMMGLQLAVVVAALVTVGYMTR